MKNLIQIDTVFQNSHVFCKYKKDKTSVNGETVMKLCPFFIAQKKFDMEGKDFLV